MAEGHFKLGDALLSFEVQGEGRPLVLVHGFPLDHTMWEAQLAALSHDFQVIAPDLRGFGKSTLADTDVDDGVGMERYAADVVAALDQLAVTEPALLVGFSMGGYVAWQIALRHRERLRGIVLCDTRAAADAEEARAGRLKMADALLAAGDATPALAMLPKLLAADTVELRGELVDQIRELILRQSPQGIAAAQRGMARRDDVRGRLGAISCPCLAIVGAEDAISPPKEMREIVAALPQARLVEIRDAGHLTPMESPEAVTAALRDFAASL